MEVNDLQVVTPQVEPGGVGNTPLESVWGVHDPQPAGQSDHEIARPLSRQPILHETIQVRVPAGPPPAFTVGPSMLGFHAKSFRYDNMTGYYVLFRDPGLWLAPWTMGGVINVPSGLSVAVFQLISTASVFSVPASPALVAALPTEGQEFLVTFYSKHQPPCPAVLIPGPYA